MMPAFQISVARELKENTRVLVILYVSSKNQRVVIVSSIKYIRGALNGKDWILSYVIIIRIINNEVSERDERWTGLFFPRKVINRFF